MSGTAPLIVTAELPAPVQGWAEGLRRAHYPPERNQVAAHVTLFHALPPSALDEARRALAQLAASLAPIPAQLSRIISLGQGTAILIESPAMLRVRAELAERFHGLLSAQDSGVPRLHITVQNKVTAAQAKALQAALAAEFQPRACAFAGMALHHYLGGPWERAGSWSFRGKEVVDRLRSAS